MHIYIYTHVYNVLCLRILCISTRVYMYVCVYIYIYVYTCVIYVLYNIYTIIVHVYQAESPTIVPGFL